MADPYSQSETFVTGDPVTAEKHNDAWDDLEAWLNESLGGMAAGQLLVGDASGTPTPVTMSGDAEMDETGEVTITTSTPTVPAIAARVTKSGNQSINDNSISGLTWDTEDFDTDGMHSTVTTNDRFTAITAGYYVATVTVAWAQDPDGERHLSIAKGTVPVIASSPVRGSALLFAHSVTTPPIHLDVGEYLRAAVYQNSGSALNVLATGFVPDATVVASSFGIYRIGA